MFQKMNIQIVILITENKSYVGKVRKLSSIIQLTDPKNIVVVN